MPDTRGLTPFMSMGVRPRWAQSLGAIYDGVATTFRVWAPDHQTIELVLVAPKLGTSGGGPDVRALTRDGHGYWFGRFDDVKPGARYGYRVDRDPARTFPDPASRFQPEGVHGPSEVVDSSAFRWTDDA